MKFTRELPSNVNVVKSYTATELRIGQQVSRSSCLVSATDLIEWRPHAIADLTIDDFATAFGWQPEIILLGTGTKQEFPAREIYAAILSRRIGFEAMDTGAACRLFNVLVGENRRVAAGLII